MLPLLLMFLLVMIIAAGCPIAATIGCVGLPLLAAVAIIVYNDADTTAVAGPRYIMAKTP